jgi:hypothetical protein
MSYHDDTHLFRRHRFRTLATSSPTPLPCLHKQTTMPRSSSRILAASATDPTAYLAKESLDAFRRIRESDSVEYERVRTLLKSANPKIRVTKLDELTQAAGEDRSRQRQPGFEADRSGGRAL